MEKALERLFDFQKFEGNAKLQQVIDSVHARYAVRMLDLDEMEIVSAAGVSTKVPEKPVTDKERK